jgi:AcrR family transcriptional regulator
MTMISQEGGRINQKRRTRAAIVAAAAELVRQGKSPTVAEVADAALVSRATAYRYFPSQEYLLAEAALQSIHGDIDETLSPIESVDDPTLRLDAVVRAL